MELFKLILPVISTLLGAGFSLILLEVRVARDENREACKRKRTAKAKVLELLLLSELGLLDDDSCRKEVTKVYASNYDVFSDDFMSLVLRCFDENGNTITSQVESLKAHIQSGGKS